jgi:hypothetical protein
MKKLIIFLVCALYSLGAFSQARDIVYFEYAYDQFPSIGKGTSVALSNQGSEISQKITLPLSGLNQGIHTLYIRCKNRSGVFTFTHIIPFYVSSVIATEINRLEYFFDEFVLPGKGNALEINNNNKYNIPLNNLSIGLHVLYLRAQNSKKEWSLVSQTLVNVYPKETPIVSIKYYFTGTGYTSPTYTKQLTSPSIDVSAELIAANSLFENNKVYTIYAWAVDQKGKEGYKRALQFTFKLLSTNIQGLQSSGLTMYPNPAKDFIYLKVGENKDLSNLEYLIYNHQGKAIDAGKVESDKIDIQTLATGNYILVVKAGTIIYKGEVFIKK